MITADQARAILQEVVETQKSIEHRAAEATRKAQEMVKQAAMARAEADLPDILTTVTTAAGDGIDRIAVEIFCAQSTSVRSAADIAYVDHLTELLTTKGFKVVEEVYSRDGGSDPESVFNGQLYWYNLWVRW